MREIDWLQFVVAAWLPLGCHFIDSFGQCRFNQASLLDTFSEIEWFLNRCRVITMDYASAPYTRYFWNRIELS